MLTVALLLAVEWTAAAPREEIKPRFSRSEDGALVIEADGRAGLNGYWRGVFPVTGARHYRFSALRRGALPAQAVPVRIIWADAEGKTVVDDRPVVAGHLTQWRAPASGEYPADTGAGPGGWTRVEGVHEAPAAARQAIVELHLQWVLTGKVEWKDPSFEAAPAPRARKVRLAAVHLQPRAGRTAQEKREQYAPLIARAAEQKADLAVLGETLTFYSAGVPAADTAEPIPGPTTTYFQQLAQKHGIYIVAGIFEREGHAVYNSAILAAPDGRLVGKYRKVTLPESEVAAGVAPGHEYPVFDTRFGKLGIMICYDGFFPEVARELTRRGAEVIAWPVWGANPDLARARAIENQVYLVSSTYEGPESNWMSTAVWDHAGKMLVQARDWGSVVVAEVDLAKPTLWRGVGDFRSKVPRHLPLPLK